MAKSLSDKKGRKVKISARIDGVLYTYVTKIQGKKRTLTDALEEMILYHKIKTNGKRNH